MKHIDKILSGLVALSIGGLLTVILFSSDSELVRISSAIKHLLGV